MCARDTLDRARRPRERFAEERAALLARRAGRIPPATDTKRVASWNGYLASGLARVASALEDEAILREAEEITDFVLETLRDDEGRLLRVFAEGRAHVTAFLDDYGALLDASLDLHRAGAGERWLGVAIALANEIVDRFYDEKARDLFLTPADGEPLPHRPRSDNDGATPHAAGHALIGLVRVGELSGDARVRDVARSVLETHAFVLEKAPHAFPTLLRAAALFDHGLSVAVVVGEPESDEAAALLARARRELGPEDAVVGIAPGETPEGVDPTWTEGRGLEGGRATAYVCHGTTCSLPITDPEAFEARG